MKIISFVKPKCFIALLWVKNITNNVKTMFTANKSKTSLKGSAKHIIDPKFMLNRGPHIVAIGGGTGLSTMLRGLKRYTSNITAVVTVADDGGGSGVLRKDLKILPPGDIRNCILALADTEPIMEQLLQYRFTKGMLKGQNFGNLFLAAMGGISENFEQAVKRMGDVLAVTGRVLPVTLEDVRLRAQLADGSMIYGESQIGDRPPRGSQIRKVYIEPSKAKPCPDVIEAIYKADAIVLGPGSLYTSVIPNLLVEGIPDAIRKSKAVKIYVCNIMTQPGETEGYSVYDHVKALEDHTYKGIIDYCIVNSQPVPPHILPRYKRDGAQKVDFDAQRLVRTGIKPIYEELLFIRDNYVRHDYIKLAEVMLRIIADNVLQGDKHRMMDYYYIKDILKRQANGA